jgi:2-polyprenyl-3-methyl-5-hydroxy-6-metoxy-1,4-benzoquinol methylase
VTRGTGHTDPGAPLAVWHDELYAHRIETLHSFKLRLLDLVSSELPGRRVLDVGCGTGQMSRRLAASGASHVVGVDFSHEGLRHAAQPVVRADLDRGLPFRSGAFDVVWCTETVEHVTWPQAFVAELRRVTAAGGLLCLSTPNSAFYMYRLLHLTGRTCSELQHPGHLRFFSPRSLRRLLEECGFAIDRLHGRGLFVALPGAWPGAARGRRSGWLVEDTLTRGTITLGCRFITRGVSFWADTLLVVARAGRQTDE